MSEFSRLLFLDQLFRDGSRNFSLRGVWVLNIRDMEPWAAPADQKLTLYVYIVGGWVCKPQKIPNLREFT